MLCGGFEVGDFISVIDELIDDKELELEIVSVWGLDCDFSMWV